MTQTNQQASVSFRPTLIIGLGGTGVRVLTELKALLQDNLGPDMGRAIKLLAFDTDDRLLEVRRQNGQLSSLSKAAGEFVHIGYVPVSQVKLNINQFPEIKNWLPPDLPPRAVTQGARMVRLLGRMSVFYHFKDVRSPLRTAIEQLRSIYELNRSVGEEGRTVMSRGINVFLVTSICGGTGAGTFIDIAYLTRYFCNRLNIKGDQISFNGVLVLPSAFTRVPQQDKIMANAKACLDDLEYLFQVHRFNQLYPGNIMVNSVDPPFTTCYLMDDANENSYKVADIEELAPVIARGIYLLTASQVAEANTSSRVNVDLGDMFVYESLDGTKVVKPAHFSGMGCATIRFPSHIFINEAAHRLCAAYLRKYVLGGVGDKEVVEPLVQDFVSATSLTSERIMEELLLVKDEKRQKVNRRINLVIRADQLDGVPSDQLSNTLQNLVSRTDSTFDNTETSLMEENRDAILVELETSLAAKMADLLDDPLYGIDAAITLATEVEKLLASLAEGLNEPKQQLEQRQNSIDTEMRKVAQQLANALNSRIPFWGNRQVAQARDESLAVHNRRLRRRLTIRQYDLALQIYARLRARAAQMRREYLKLKDKLSRILSVIDSRQINLQDRDEAIGPLEWAVVGDQDFDKYYNERVPAESQWSAQVEAKCGQISLWVEESEDKILDLLLVFGREPFLNLTQIRLEEAIKNSSNTDPAQAVQFLRDRAVPLWVYDTERLGSARDGKTIEVNVFGIADAEKSVFNNLVQEEGMQMASIGDPQQATMLRTLHGLASVVLAQYDEYAQNYNFYMREAERTGSLIPLRLFEPTKEDEFVEAATNRKMLLFAMGEAFSYIQRDGAYTYHFYRKEELSKPEWRKVERLGQGLEKAIDGLGLAPQLMDEIEVNVSTFQAREGTRKVKEVFLEYLGRPAGNKPEIQDELNRGLKLWLFEQGEML